MPKVEGYIKRKSMLYKTGVEYGDYTLNFVQGCAHGCRYPCYAFLLKKRFGQIKTMKNGWSRNWYQTRWSYWIRRSRDLKIKSSPCSSASQRIPSWWDILKLRK